MRKLEVTAYQEKWPFLFKTESDKLIEIFGDEIEEVYHIGSTAVPGLKAKPVIDIMPVVKNITRVDAYEEEMKALGYEPKGENGLSGRRYFQKGRAARTHHVHVYQEDNPEVERHLAFRDYLRSHPEAVREYGDLKAKLAKQFPYEMESYIQGKEKLVMEIKQKALRRHEARRT